MKSGQGAGGGHDLQGVLFPENPQSFDVPRHSKMRIGVVDVGSNSVRMVVFEDGRRCPAMIFNEKALCGLGAQLEQTGKLDPEGMERALNALERFMVLAPGLRVGALVGVATAALREAKDGRAFRDKIEERTGIRLRIASGEEEARLSAQGVLFGDPDAHGLVVDLGGASVEFCPVENGAPMEGVTTPLGPQRLKPIANDAYLAKALIDETLAPLAERFKGHSSRINLVGGAWRALGRVQLQLSKHPMNILHEFTFTADEARKLAAWVIDAEADDIAGLPGVPSARVPTLPHAARLLEGLLEHFQPEDLRISGFGLREGVCYDFLPQSLRRRNPLISTCEGQERTRARLPGFGKELAGWLEPVFAPADDRERVLMRAVCHLVDVSWRAHPEYRSDSCVEVVTRTNVTGVGHRGRAFMAAALLMRYKGRRKALSNQPATKLLSENEIDRASQLGALMRLGATISGSTPGYLPQSPITLDEEALVLRPTREGRGLVGEDVEKRLAQAARAFGVTGQIAGT